ncbi:unnamed protein product [Ceratitis capitata]|uniref:(Mediterranean fruit fly) hypothetical protein n=1 Tax=Ceratitis capitata TaxID=7213 RepID=A0A811U7K8_CERCA|nr:unnamed protein product [Ceratitis capitata]
MFKRWYRQESYTSMWIRGLTVLSAQLSLSLTVTKRPHLRHRRMTTAVSATAPRVGVHPYNLSKGMNDSRTANSDRFPDRPDDDNYIHNPLITTDQQLHAVYSFQHIYSLFTYVHDRLAKRKLVGTLCLFIKGGS